MSVHDQPEQKQRPYLKNKLKGKGLGAWLKYAGRCVQTPILGKKGKGLHRAGAVN
jgi:hypothetical protein